MKKFFEEPTVDVMKLVAVENTTVDAGGPGVSDGDGEEDL